MSLEDKARWCTASEFAQSAHNSIKQVRKYSKEPYWIHSARVASILSTAGVRDGDIIAAAFLHDVIEDVYPINKNYSPEIIQDLFGARVMRLVMELTNVYTKDAYPRDNRAVRHAKEAQRIATISPAALKVKFADIIDNMSDIMKYDPGYGVVYAKEKLHILNLAVSTVKAHSGDAALRKLYHQAIAAATVVPPSMEPEQNLENLTEKVLNNEKTRKELKDLLHTHVMEVTFMKVDGTKRKMRCTLRTDLLPEPTEKTSGRVAKTPNQDVIAVYDLDKSDWRSFRVDSIVRYQALP